MKKPTKKDKKRIDAFLKEYKELSLKHKLDIKGELSLTAEGIIPVMKIVKIKESK